MKHTSMQLIITTLIWLVVGCSGDESSADLDTSNPDPVAEMGGMMSNADMMQRPQEDLGDREDLSQNPDMMSSGDMGSTMDMGGMVDMPAGEDMADAGGQVPMPQERPDFNGDGEIHILVLGSTEAVRGGIDEFSPVGVAAELDRILKGDANIAMPVSVVAEDIHMTFLNRTGIQYSDGTVEEINERVHSMLQYYYWPDGQEARHENLAGRGSVDWDHVIIASDPRIVARTPGFFALGVNTIAEQVRSGDAQPRLLMVWPSQGDDAPLSLLEEFTYRVGDSATPPIPITPAGLAWDALSERQRDMATEHPTPNGAYLAAATIYAQLFERSASASSYTHDDAIADQAMMTVEAAATASHYDGPVTHDSAFSPGDIAARPILFHMTGTSSERGIRGGIRRAAVNVEMRQVADDAPFAHFNYGRANRFYEANKQYTYDPTRFDYAFGFPMHTRRDIDGVSNAGEDAMCYGLDARDGRNPTGFGQDPTSTDLGIALYMADEGQTPHGRAIPVRALFAIAREAHARAQSTGSFPGFQDNTHMSRDLDTASGSFLYTLLTGHCAVPDEPDLMSSEWRQWLAHRIGYETAWTMMHLRGVAPGFRVIPESQESVSVSPTQSATLSISFANKPTEDVVVHVTTDKDSAVMLSPTELIFTPENHATPQVVTMIGQEGAAGSELFTISSTTSSDDANFNGFVDRWEYTAIRP